MCIISYIAVQALRRNGWARAERNSHNLGATFGLSFGGSKSFPFKKMGERIWRLNFATAVLRPATGLEFASTFFCSSLLFYWNSHAFEEGPRTLE